MESYLYILTNHDSNHSQTENVAHLQSHSLWKNNCSCQLAGNKLKLPVSICNGWLLILSFVRGSLK